MIKKGDYFAQFNEDLPEGYDILRVEEVLEDSIEAEGITIGPADLHVRQWAISKFGLRYWTPISSEDANFLFELFNSTLSKVKDIVMNAEQYEYDHFQVGNCYRCKTKDFTIIYVVAQCCENKRYYKSVILGSGSVDVEGAIRINKLEVTHELYPIDPNTFDMICSTMQMMATSAIPIVRQKYDLFPD